MSIELYVFPPSPRAFKVMAVANHLGLDCTLRIVDLTKGEQNAPQYEALNPNMRMPTLKDGDHVLWESNAILQYLAARKPESGLLPMSQPPAPFAFCSSAICARAASTSSGLVLACPASPHPPSIASVRSTHVLALNEGSPAASGTLCRFRDLSEDLTRHVRSDQQRRQAVPRGRG